MKNCFYKMFPKLGILFCITAPTLSLAVPAAFEAKDCGKLEIDNTTTSTVIRDHNNCSKVWVMPPSMGLITTKSFQRNSNLGFCIEMKDLQKTTRSISKKISLLDDKINEMTPAIRRAQRKLDYAREKLAKSSDSDEIKTLRDLTNQKEEIEIRLAEIEDKLDNCTSACDALEDNYKDLRVEKRRVNFEMRKLRSSHRLVIKKFKDAQVKYSEAEKLLEKEEGRVFKHIDNKTKLRNIIFSMYKDFSLLEGGTVAVDYNLNWNENEVELERMYPQYNFEKVETRNARLNANFVGANEKDTYANSIPALLDYSIAGFKYLPYGINEDANITSVPDRLTGNLRLSLPGACPYYFKNYDSTEITGNELEVDETIKTKEFNYGMSISYEYPSVFQFVVEAKYNLYKFYEKVVRSGSKGGFFSSRSWKKVTETKTDDETFSITWLDEAGEYTPEMKEKIRNTLKTELAARALQNMGQRASSNSTPLVAVNAYNPGPGALVLAEGLQKTCGFNIYCQGGSWLLKGLTSIFGGSKAEASFKSTHNSTVTERWDDMKTRYRAGVTSFSKE